MTSPAAAKTIWVTGRLRLALKVLQYTLTKLKSTRDEDCCNSSSSSLPLGDKAQKGTEKSEYIKWAIKEQQKEKEKESATANNLNRIDMCGEIDWPAQWSAQQRVQSGQLFCAEERVVHHGQ